MQISFFEEFPTPQNLRKIKLVSKPVKLYLAARSVAEFETITQKIKRKRKSKKIKEMVYWPVLQQKEGYWISPFSSRKALKQVFQELEGKKISVMLDLELPTTQNFWLYFTQLPNFFRNKILIQNFISRYPGKIYLAEYFLEGRRAEKWMQRLGLHYSTSSAFIIKMLYHSLHHFDAEFMEKELYQGKKEYQDRFIIGLGTIAKGIQGNENMLSASRLRRDLNQAKKAGVKEVVIFRLGGLNEKYSGILQKFSP